MFSDELISAMDAVGITSSELSKKTGISKVSISQYRSGRNNPSPKNKKILEDALRVKFEDVKRSDVEPEGVKRITVNQAAKILHVNHETLCKGIRQGVFPWAYAIKTTENRWTYIINGDKFCDTELKH